LRTLRTNAYINDYRQTDKDTKEIIHGRYYYKCETEGCELEGKSARAGVVLKAAQEFFSTYLFVTKNNYADFVKRAKKTVDSRSAEFDSAIGRLKIVVANKERAYEQTKDLIRNNPELKDHYDLDNCLHLKNISNSLSPPPLFWVKSAI
jgi:hypothetical protein